MTINYLAENYEFDIIYDSVHPRSKKFIEKRKFIFSKELKPLDSMIIIVCKKMLFVLSLIVEY